MSRAATMGNLTESSYRAAWPDFSCYRPHPAAAQLREWLGDAQRLTATLTRHCDDANAKVPMLAIVNPPLWELGHLAWFEEFWLHRGGNFQSPSLLAGADHWYDSARVGHDSRWSLDLPDFSATRAYAAAVHERSMALLEGGETADELAYFAQLAIFHQDMHNEAFSYTWQTLGLEMPARLPEAALTAAVDIDIPGGTLMLGASPAGGFVFDNEKWAHEVKLQPFSIASQVVSNAAFLAFVEDHGYTRQAFWGAAGWSWRERLALRHPRYWQREDNRWTVRRFDRQMPLPMNDSLTHVSAHEAEAYCRWAGRRLPSEAEWQRAASNAGGHFEYGQVWEWTSSRFLPFAGFSPDPYAEYSAPWFEEEHRVLRGGSFATPRRLMRPGFRNFYNPDRADMFCGFRTCGQ